MLYIFFWGVYVFTFFYVFFVGAVQGCDVGGAETQCRIYSGKWYDGASAWGGTGYNVGAGVVRYSLSGLGKLLKRFWVVMSTIFPSWFVHV